MKPETAFRINKVDKFLKKLPGTWSVSVQQQSIRGTPDKLLCIRGKFVALELKSAGGKLTKLQEYTLLKIEDSGGIAILVSPTNWAAVKEQLLQLAGE